MTLKTWFDTYVLFPIWLRLTIWMGYNFCIWSPKEFSGDIRVIHLYDTEWNLRRSMASYMATCSNHNRKAVKPKEAAAIDPNLLHKPTLNEHGQFNPGES